MDKQQLEHLLWNLKPSSESIKKTAEYCSSYPEAVNQIVQTIEEIFYQSMKERKKILIFLIHEIILDEKGKVQSTTQEHPFIRIFGNQLKNIFTEFVNQTDKLSDLDQISTVIKRWEKEFIYHPSFIDKLKIIVVCQEQFIFAKIKKPKLDLLKRQAETFNNLNQKDSSIVKLLQHNIKTVQEIPNAGKVYSYLQQQQRVDEETLKFSSDFDKINFLGIENMKLEQLIEKGKVAEDKLKQVIMNNQSLQKEMGDLVATMLDDYVKFDKESEISHFHEIDIEKNDQKKF